LTPTATVSTLAAVSRRSLPAGHGRACGGACGRLRVTARAASGPGAACRWARRGSALIAGLLALVWAGATLAPAEHEVQYRYVVLGYATDVKGRPLRGQPVKLVRDRTGFAYRGETDAAGFYAIIVRLGNENAGERLTLTVGRVVTVLAARFDPRNHSDERGTRVDIVANRAVERPAWFAPSLKRFLSAR
jgi:hypothetical protein